MERTQISLVAGIVIIVIGAGLGYWALNRNDPTGVPTPTPTVPISSTPTATPTAAPTATPTPSPSPTPAQYEDLLKVTAPLPSASVASPLVVSGSARGTWYSEAVFPVVLLDGTGQQIAQGQAQAQGEWMTEAYVPFTATLTFTKPATATGTLVLKKDNPSGLPANDKSLSIPIKF